MLVLELALFRFRNNKGKPDTPVIGFFVIVVALPAGLVLLYLASNPGFITGSYTYRNFNLEERLLTEGRVLVFYLKSILIPSISELGLFHDDIAISHGLFDPPATFYSLLALGGMLLGALLLLGRQPLVSLGILWFFTGHLMESTIIGLELVHEHRNYLADYGIILAVAILAAQAPLRRLGPVIRIATPAVFLMLYSYTTWVRATQWSDVVSQAVYEARHHPQSYRAVFAAGRIYANLTLSGAPEFENEARELLVRAGDLSKGEILSHSALILFSYELNQPIDPDWYDELFYRLSNYPVVPATLISLRAFVKCAEKDCGVPAETLETMFNLTMSNETTRLSNKRLSETEALYGAFAINTQKDIIKGHRLFTQAVAHSPRDTHYWQNLINLLIAAGDLDEAQDKLELFRSANTYAGNEGIYQTLQNSIKDKHLQQTTSAKFDSTTDK
jgi:tetratricopeptide (TPR) repeat protein